MQVKREPERDHHEPREETVRRWPRPTTFPAVLSAAMWRSTHLYAPGREALGDLGQTVTTSFPPTT